MSQQTDQERQDERERERAEWERNYPEGLISERDMDMSDTLAHACFVFARQLAKDPRNNPRRLSVPAYFRGLLQSEGFRETLIDQVRLIHEAYKRKGEAP